MFVETNNNCKCLCLAKSELAKLESSLLRLESKLEKIRYQSGPSGWNVILLRFPPIEAGSEKGLKIKKRKMDPYWKGSMNGQFTI